MPPRTGPRRRKRLKPTPLPLRHFAVIRGEASTGRIVSELVTAHSLELDDHDLVFRDGSGAISRVFARDGWLEVRPAMIAGSPAYPPSEAGLNSGIDERPAEETDEVVREQAIAALERAIPPRTVEIDTVLKPTREEAERFVPSSPEEAQRILRELHRRLAPDYQDPEPDLQPDPAPAQPASRRE